MKTNNFVDISMSILCLSAAFFLLCCVLSGCTYNVTMAHTEGAATDLIDETSSNTPQVSTEIRMPI